MSEIINIVEPTLANETGHCYSFINALCDANERTPEFRLWVDRQAELELDGKNIRIKRYFFRKMRRLQIYFLYRKILSEPGKVFISTAGRSDLLMVNWASPGKLPPNKVYFYFHWLNANEKKIASLKKIAGKQPNLEILGPTTSVTKVFLEAGFGNVQVVPYPISQKQTHRNTKPAGFGYLLYAGAARQDKGFSYVINLIEHLDELRLKIPVMLQTSPMHYGKYDEVTKTDIQRLANLSYPYLRVYPKTLAAEEYKKLFEGAICLQLYDPNDFSDRISGVTLDAFSAGCPVVTSAGTWIARMVKRFDSGIVIDSTEPSEILSAIQRIIDDYPKYSKNAADAGSTLQQENSAEILLRILMGRVD